MAGTRAAYLAPIALARAPCVLPRCRSHEGQAERGSDLPSNDSFDRGSGLGPERELEVSLR